MKKMLIRRFEKRLKKETAKKGINQAAWDWLELLGWNMDKLGYPQLAITVKRPSRRLIALAWILYRIG